MGTVSCYSRATSQMFVRKGPASVVAVLILNRSGAGYGELACALSFSRRPVVTFRASRMAVTFVLNILHIAPVLAQSSNFPWRW